MKKYILLLSTFLGFFVLHAQQNGVCGFDEHNQKLMEKSSNAGLQIHEQILRAKSNAESSSDRAIGIVPVVVHVIHDGGASNISYQQIESAIQMLNEDYQQMNADSTNIRNTADAPFKPVASNMDIQFELAKIDPNGNCTNGVDRRYSPGSAENADDDVKHYSSGGLDAWPRDSYLNIWVVKSISGSSGGTTLGYAQFPYFGAADTYGVVIRHDRMGNTGTAVSGDRTLTHELGHCFGLSHTFQGGCDETDFSGNATNDCSQGGDYCCDTPPVSEAQWSCSNAENNCTNVPANDFYGIDVHDQYENFMSYSPCQFMFSSDQRDIVQGNFSSIGFMQSLISPANATATGVGSPAQLCKAEFTSSNTIICEGMTVDFIDESYFNVTGTDWTFNGGTPATSTDSMPVVTYNTAGVYDVTLSATDGSNTVSTTESAYVTVLSSPGQSLPYIESFENYSTWPDNQNWLTVNNDGGPAFQLNGSAAASGSNSIKLGNFGNSNASKDQMISGTIDLSAVAANDDLIITFKYAYRKRSASNDEWLRFYISDDCGESWILRKNIHGSGLSSNTLSTSYTPVDGDWVEVEITNVTSTYFVENFRIMFEFENDNGNNIYIDDINISTASMAGIENNNIADNLSIYPNPVNEQFTIYMDVYDAATYKMTLTNALGQEVATVYQGELLSGSQKVQYDASNLTSGVYFLNVYSNGQKKTVKVLKQ